MATEHPVIYLEGLLKKAPQAIAFIRGDSLHHELFGTVRFYDSPYGTLVAASFEGLPFNRSPCQSPVLALHIHEGPLCDENTTPPFSGAGGHYNPKDCPHPRHAGDLPPLFSSRGTAYSVTLTDRFTPRDVIGKTVIVHDRLDDFTTQPAGNAGQRIACGVIIGKE